MFTLRIYTQEGKDPLALSRFRAVTGEGGVEYTVPFAWNRAAVELLLDKVFCPHPLPAITKKVSQEGMPEWLWPSVADVEALDTISAEWRYVYETDIRDVLHRIAGGLAYAAWRQGIFKAEAEARIFYDELRHVLFHQMASPEISLWASAGLAWAYGLTEASGFAPRHTISSFDPSLPRAYARARIMAETAALEGDGASIALTLPADNADSIKFAGWKRDEDIRRLAEDIGLRTLKAGLHHVVESCERGSFFGFDWWRNKKLSRAMLDARNSGLSEAAVRMAVTYAEQGYEDIRLPQPANDAGFEGGVRTFLSLSDEFIECALTGHGVMLKEGGSHVRHASAEKIWETTLEALWSSAGPGLVFCDKVQPSVPGGDVAVDESGSFVFAPGAAAPGFTLNLLKTPLEAIPGVVRIMAVAADAALPEPCLKNRALMLGLTNLASLLMERGIAYDSAEGRSLAALYAALLTSSAALASADMAARVRSEDATHALRFMKDKSRALGALAKAGDSALLALTKKTWADAIESVAQNGLRHLHLTGIADDVHVQALLAAETPGIAPAGMVVGLVGRYTEFGDTPLYAKRLSPMVPRALTHLGYSSAARDDIHFYVAGHGTLLDAPFINHASLRGKGFHQAALGAVDAALSGAMHIRYAFNRWTLGDDFCRRVLGFTIDDMEDPAFDMLSALGFTEDEIEAANIYCCGALSLEGAPHLKPEHLAVFDCAAAGAGVRSVSAEAQIKMQAQAGAFLSGAAAQTVLLPHAATIDDVKKLSLLAWESGAKVLRLYREKCSWLHAFAPESLAPAHLTETKEEEDISCQQKQSVNA